MAAVNKTVTTNNGDDYVQECVDAGVPVPATVIDVEEGWEITSESIAHPFMEPSLDDARLWTFENTPSMAGPDGICMALPRGPSGQNSIVVGVICMGWNGNTCYFTNADGTTFNPIEAIGIEELAGGTDLVGAPEGPCSDCHAGENPFIIHPEDAAFIEAQLLVSRVFPDAWPTPIVPAALPGNPDPLDVLGPVSEGQVKCDMCHRIGGSGGRFPLVSNAYGGFCDEVLAPAVGETSTPQTMPLSDYDASDFGDQAAWLKAACATNSGGGVVVPFVPPQLVVRPPNVDSPYICSKSVHVRNAVYGAQLKLSLNGVQVATGTYRDPDHGYTFSLAAALIATDSLAITQKVGGITSPATLVFVRDHTDDYPDGLPAPIISPAPLYECASSIAVVNVPGVELTVVKTPPSGTATSSSIRTGAGHTWVSGLGTFVIGTSVKVRQKLCTDTSAYSESEIAEDAPLDLPELQFDPPLVVGQPVVRFNSVVQGSSVNLKEAVSAIVVYNNVSVPYNSWRSDVTTSLGGPVQAGHDIVPIQTLCGVSSEDPNFPPPVACDEGTLVPRIARPHAGDDFVLVTYSVPGSTVRVFDTGAVEIGNGSSGVIGLSRALVSGEIINVTAALPTCSLARAFSISVSG